MTVSNQDPVDRYSGTGALDTFAITFPFSASTEIQVWLRDESVAIPTEAQQTTPAQYSVVGTDVVFVTDPLATDIVVIKRRKPFIQTLDLIDGGPVEEEAIEGQLDKMILSQQQLEEKADRALLLPETSILTDIQLPEFVGNANKLLGINATEDGIDATTVDLATITSDIATNTANIATNTANISSNDTDIATNVTNIATNVTNIGTNTTGVANNAAAITANTNNIGTNDTELADHETRIASLEAGTDVVSFSGSQGIQDAAAAATDLVELAFDGDDFQSAIIEYEIFRATDAPDVRFSSGTLYAQFTAGAWRVELGNQVGDFHGVSFAVATDGGNVGRVSYTTDDMPGTANSYCGGMQYKVRKYPTGMLDAQTLDDAAAATDITKLVFDGDVFSSVIINYEIDRSTDDPDVRFSTGTIYMQFVPPTSTWRVEFGEQVGDFHGVTLSVDQTGNVGQLQYATDDMPGGTYAGKIKFEFKTFLRATQVD